MSTEIMTLKCGLNFNSQQKRTGKLESLNSFANVCMRILSDA